LADRGAEIISADELAREVMSPGTPVWKKVIQAFGPSVQTSTGALRRKHLAALIFANYKARRTLEGITHPAIWKLLRQKLRVAKRIAPLVAIEIPLYFEGGHRLAGAMEIWVVYVDKNTQLKRLMKRDGLTKEEAEIRLKTQLPLSCKCDWADRVIDNTGPKKDTFLQVQAALTALMTASKTERFCHES
ncbi:MAG TPA: dephospho-CoA kinase, partial [bacterium]|nr:dephospho-CoA kinase [bacterium]